MARDGKGRDQLPSMIWSYDDLLAAGIRLSMSQLWRLERAGRFPKRMRISSRVGWVPEEIRAYIEEKKAARAA